MKASHAVATMLLLSGLLLVSLAPGGPIETRDFSHISPVVLGLFNVFLTTLGLGTFWVAWLVMKERLSGVLPFLAGASYFLVYVLDLLGMFPVTPTPMTQALWSIEVVGATVAVPLMLFSLCGLRSNTLNRERESFDIDAPSFPRVTWFIAGSLGLLVVVFTTLAAMGN